MTRIAYYLVLKPLSLLPFFILNRIADLFYLVFLTVFQYRRKVVMDNLTGCFPEKDEKELKKIACKFYRHFADMIVESVKNFSISKEGAMKMMKNINSEILHELQKEGKSIAICGGHYANWELYAMVGGQHVPMFTLGIYKKIKDKFLDQKMQESRGKYGMNLIATVEATEWLKTNRDLQKAVIYAFDQSPANPAKAHWMTFLGRDTPVYFGPEKHANEFNMAVVFGHFQKLGRNQYAIEYELITKDPSELAHGELTEIMMRKLEADIIAEPAYWLWTHKRWKHEKKRAQFDPNMKAQDEVAQN
jgi:Kdo2-lipid IVA lauroyltransferase/acyltransferase